LQHETIAGVRMAAIDALEVLNDARVIPAFLALLPRARANEKIRIVGALNSFGDASVVPELLILYKQADVGLREIILHTASTLDPSMALPALREAVYDADLIVCTSAARALVKIGSEGAIDVLVEAFIMMSKSQCEVLAHTISAYQIDGIIVQLDDAYQKQKVVYRAGAEREKSAKIRRRIIWVMGLLKNKNSIATLLQSMDDEDVIVQRETIIAFKNICDERVLPALITILRWRFEDYDEKTLVCAVQAVGQIGNVNSVPHLQAVLETALNGHTELAVQIIQVIGAIGAYETIEYLKKIKNRLKREERYPPEKAQELIETIEQAIGKMRSRIA
jgi:HEAT repeat protein